MNILFEEIDGPHTRENVAVLSVPFLLILAELSPRKVTSGKHSCGTFGHLRENWRQLVVAH